MKNKVEQRKRRHIRIRKKIIGTKDMPRLAVFKSLNHIYASLIDDIERKTIITVSTLSLKIKNGGNITAAKVIGENIAKKAKEKNIEKVVFDRAGYPYHGRIKAVADTARKEGLKF